MTGLLRQHPSEISSLLTPGQRLLGLDPGTRVIGLAVSDATLTIASPIGTLRRGKLSLTAREITALAHQRNIGGIVVGLPVNMDGTVGRRAEATRDWARALAGQTGLPTAFWDERMSTQAVTRAMIAADLSRKKRARRVDEAAAAYILQGALDAISSPGPGRTG